RDARSLSVFGRLRQDASLSDARAEMALIAGQLETNYAKENKGIRINVKTFNDEYNGGQIRVVFLALLGAVGCVLLVACANVSNLLLALRRSRERDLDSRGIGSRPVADHPPTASRKRATWVWRRTAGPVPGGMGR